MDKKTLTPVIVLAVATGFAVFIAGFQSIGQAQARRENAALELRIQELQKETEAARAAERKLRAEMSERAAQVDQQSRKAGELQAQLDRIIHPPENAPSCVDSDQSMGAESIYVRGSVSSGYGQSMDHCRLGQLVEFTCIENPVGSGRFLIDAKIMDCPAGSRCVSGECLR